MRAAATAYHVDPGVKETLTVEPKAFSCSISASCPALSVGGTALPVATSATRAQIESTAFKVIVGDLSTQPEAPVGTVYDATVGNGLGEIKIGTSVLDSSSQLRLQTYGAIVNNTPFAIYDDTNQARGPTLRGSTGCTL